jgi:oligopeptide transport system ATP-binding protein
MRKDIALSVCNLSIQFQGQQNSHEAVKSISFDLPKGKIVALVGESGSGKTATALALTGLLESNAVVTGNVFYAGSNILEMESKALRKIRGKQIAYIFQEPGGSLNPVFTIGYQISETIALHTTATNALDRKEQAIAILEAVGIHHAERCYHAYPHELSGGMQQRIMIAMAIVCKPEILIADEPTTALDATIQKQILDLLKQVQKDFGTSILLITHNFGIVSHIADEVMVMHKGSIVESGTISQIMQNPQHPYTKGLMLCIPRLGERKERLITLFIAS